MSRMTKQNLHNIQCVFEEKTGVDLNPEHRYKGVSRRKVLVAFAAAVCCLLLASCTYLIFSPLYGDDLSLSGVYQGNGIAEIQVVNGSEKKLRFQPHLKLMSWKNGEIPSTGGEVEFDNTVFPAHSSGVMTVDLSKAYSMDALEGDRAFGDLYLVLTNRDFQFGHDWICFIHTPDRMPEETEESVAVPITFAENSVDLNAIDPSLRFYFEKVYLDVSPSHNRANGEYMMAVQELLATREGVQVHSVDPLLCANNPASGVIFDENWGVDNQHQLIMQNNHSIDSMGRMVGSVFPGNGMDTALMISVPLPQYAGETGGGIGGFDLLYYFIFATQEIRQKDAYGFVYGRIVDFGELEDKKVFEDEQYTIYDLTDLFYTDVDAYLDEFLSEYRGEFYCDEKVRQMVRDIYHYYRDPENIGFHYVLPPNAGKAAG